MDDDVSARLALPLLRPGQAQKELFHNEALARIDIALQASVVAVGLDMPPASPALGACWVIGAVPTGAWAGHARAIAGWTGGGWRFVAPANGMAVWSEADGALARYTGGAWSIGDLRGHRLVIDGVGVVGTQAAAIADPTGGMSVDFPARTAIGAILTALRGHGLIAS